MTENHNDDPEWVKQISQDVELENFDKKKKLIKELFLEYVAEGIPTMEAYRKAKKVAAMFNQEIIR